MALRPTSLNESVYPVDWVRVDERRWSGYADPALRWSPGLRETVKTLFAIRSNCIVLRRRLLAKWAPVGEAEAGTAGEQPAGE